MNSNETVLITGADRGLGFALAERFANAGFRVFAGSRRGGGEPLRKLAAAHDGAIEIVDLDVADPASIREASQSVTLRADAIDVVINNAALCPPETLRTLTEVDIDDGHLESLMAVNAFGPLRVTRAFLSLMEAGRRRMLVNISSEAGSIGDCNREGWFGYCMSKAALNMQSMNLQRWLAPKGFKVLSVHPGWVRSDMGGPDAELEPSESAAAIYDLATREWAADAAVFMDHLGTALRW